MDELHCLALLCMAFSNRLTITFCPRLSEQPSSVSRRMLHQVIDVISSVVPRWNAGSGGETKTSSLLPPHLYPTSLISSVVPLWSDSILETCYEPRRPNSCTESSMLRLPSEVLAQILQHLARDDLSTVCRVSRELLDEAERFMYVRVELRNVNRIKTWCDTMSQRPHLSLRTRSLKITMPRQTNTFESMDLWQLNKACKSCTNLTELFILVDEDETLLDWDQYIDPLWFIEDCPFHLTKFVCNYLPPKLLGIFFISQPNIRTLSVRGDWGVKASSGILPSLTSIDVDTFPAVRVSKPQAIRTLQIHLSMFGAKLSAVTRALTRHYSKLTNLSLVCNSTPWSMTEILQSIGDALPSLKSFCYFDERTSVCVTFSCKIHNLIKSARTHEQGLWKSLDHVAEIHPSGTTGTATHYMG